MRGPQQDNLCIVSLLPKWIRRLCGPKQSKRNAVYQGSQMQSHHETDFELICFQYVERPTNERVES